MIGEMGERWRRKLGGGLGFVWELIGEWRRLWGEDYAHTQGSFGCFVVLIEVDQSVRYRLFWRAVLPVLATLRLLKFDSKLLRDKPRSPKMKNGLCVVF